MTSTSPACTVGREETLLADVVTTFSFHPSVLSDLGVTVQSQGATRAAPQHALSILPGPASSFDGVSECMAVVVTDDHLTDFLGGRIAHTGGPTLRHGRSAVSLAGFELRVGDEPRTFDIVTASGERALLGTLPHYQIDVASGLLDVFNVDLAVTPALAARWDARHLAGTVVGTLSLRAKVVLPSPGVSASAAPLSAAGVEETGPQNACDDFSGDVDVALIAMDAIQQQGRLGNRVVITPSATLKNVGTANVPWQARFSGRFPPYDTDQHPYLVWSLFRNTGGIFEPLAYSDVKHAFLTINANCAPGACRIGSVLGLGCEDVYGVGTNGTHLAPRSEILPHAGTWAHCDFPAPNTPSHYDQAAPFCVQDFAGATENILVHRAVVSDAELGVASARYYFAAWYVVRDDINIYNSMGWRLIAPIRSGNTWTFQLSKPFRQGSVLDAFVDPASQNQNRKNTRYDDPDAGALQMAVTATDLQTGQFRYVYVLMNHDFDPTLSAFALPVGEGVVIEQPRFMDGDEDVTNDWILSVGTGQVTWAAPPAPAARLAWGKAITITFIANGPPIANPAHVTRADNGEALLVDTLLPGGPAAE